MTAGVETMFYTREVPWHTLGKPVLNAPNSAEAIKLAEIEWEVFSAPLRAILSDGTIIEIPEKVANIRSSDNSVLGVVSDKYRIVQNREAFAFTDALLGGSANVRYETAGSLFGGRQVWMLARMDGITVLGDQVDPYLVFTNSHDGSTGVRVAITPIRVVCNNTLTLAMDSAVRIWSTVHMGDLESKLHEAQETLKKASVYLENFPVIAEQMAETNIYADEVESILDKLFPTPEVEKVGKIAVQNIERQKNLLYNLWTTTPDIQKFEGTSWGMYNALSDMVGHMKPLRETSTWQERRFATITEGHPLLEKAQKILMAVKR